MGAKKMTQAEEKQFLMLRALEWGKWPLFVLQPIAPILLLFAEWWKVLTFEMLAYFTWGLVRYRFVSLKLATAGAFFVKLKWPVSLGVGAYFAYSGNWAYAVLAAAWPLITLVLTAFQFSPLSYGKIEREFAKQAGLIPKWAEFDD